MGDFTEWQRRPIELKRQKDGVWRATVPLEAGTHEYRFIVDGVREVPGRVETSSTIPATATAEEFAEGIHRLNEAFPCPMPATTAEWIRELREGEQD